MTSDDVALVQRSWRDATRGDRRAITYGELIRLLGRSVDAGWLIAGIDELIGLLATPSELGARARTLDARRPPGVPSPTFAVEGAALLGALDAAVGELSSEVALAWRQAWHLLAEEIAADQLSPFVPLEDHSLEGDPPADVALGPCCEVTGR